MTCPEKPLRADAGLTLIELVVALAVFALVATMSLQAITGSLRQRDRLSATADRAAALATTATLLRSDLSYMAPALFHDPAAGGGPASAFHAPAEGEHLAFSALRARPPEASPAGQPVRIEWRRVAASGTLERRLWPGTQPASGEVAGPWVPLLHGVQAFEIESLDAAGQWQAGDGLLPDTAGFTDALPRAVRARFTLTGTGPVEILVVRP